MEHSSFIILDVETTRNPQTNNEEIIEIACIKINDTFESLGEFHTLIKPSCPLSYITKIKTGISDSDLSDKPNLKDILNPFFEFIGENIIIAHNAIFDYRVLKENLNRYRFRVNNYFVDSLSLLKVLFPNEKCSLISLKDKFDVRKNHHRALDDVYSLREILMYSDKHYLEKFNRHILEGLHKFKVREQYTQTTFDF